MKSNKHRKLIDQHESQQNSQNQEEQEQYQSLKIKPKDCQKYLQKLKEYKNQKKLTELNIAKCEVNLYQLKYITSLSWPSLKILTLVRNNFFNQGIKLLNKTYLPNLMELRLGYCKIGDEGIKHITKSMWPKLRHFNLTENCIRITGYQDLYKTQYRNLQNLWEQTIFFTSQIDSISVLALVCLISACTKIKICLNNPTFDENLKQMLSRRFIKLGKK